MGNPRANFSAKIKKFVYIINRYMPQNKEGCLSTAFEILMSSFTF